MKKLLLLSIIFAFIPAFNFSEINASAYVDDYTRIYKENGVWYGVIDIENRRIFETVYDPPASITQPIRHYYIEFAFTRETQYVVSVDLKYTVGGYCPLPFNICSFGGYVEPYESEIITFEYDQEQIGLQYGTSLDEIFGDGEITKSVDPEYDYVIDLGITVQNDVEVPVNVEFLEFTYVLTNAEVDAVMADIQTQYDNEVTAILENNDLNITEKQLALDNLNLEYQEYTITYQEEITSLCLDNDVCNVSNNAIGESPPLDTVPDWFSQWGDNMFAAVSKVIVYVITTIISVAFITFLIYRASLKVAEGTGYVLCSAIKAAGKSGAYWGKKLGAGIITFILTVGKGLTAIFNKQL